MKKKPDVTPWPRKLARSVARANMADAGMRKINRKYAAGPEDKKQSVFSQNWREYAALQNRRSKHV